LAGTSELLSINTLSLNSQSTGQLPSLKATSKVGDNDSLVAPTLTGSSSPLQQMIASNSLARIVAFSVTELPVLEGREGNFSSEPWGQACTPVESYSKSVWLPLGDR